jgi:hypothetical protein
MDKKCRIALDTDIIFLDIPPILLYRLPQEPS